MVDGYLLININPVHSELSLHLRILNIPRRASATAVRSFDLVDERNKGLHILAVFAIFRAKLLDHEALFHPGLHQ